MNTKTNIEEFKDNVDSQPERYDRIYLNIEKRNKTRTSTKKLCNLDMNLFIKIEDLVYVKNSNKLSKLKSQQEYDVKVKDNLIKIYNNKPLKFSKTETPTVSQIQPFENLIAQKFDGKSLKDFTSFESKIIEEGIFKWRKQIDDGNSFYRGIMYSYMEMIIMDNKVELLEMLILEVSELINAEHPSMKVLEGGIRRQILDYCNKKFFLHIFVIYDSLKEQSESNSQTKKLEIYHFFLKSMNFNKNFDLALVYILRFKIYYFFSQFYNRKYSQENPIQLFKLLPPEYQSTDSTVKFAEFYEENLLKLSKSPPELSVLLTPIVLKINLNLLKLVTNNGKITEITKNEYKSFLENKPSFSLIMKENLYDIILEKEYYKANEYLLNTFQENLQTNYINNEGRRTSVLRQSQFRGQNNTDNKKAILDVEALKNEIYNSGQIRPSSANMVAALKNEKNKESNLIIMKKESSESSSSSNKGNEQNGSFSPSNFFGERLSEENFEKLNRLSAIDGKISSKNNLIEVLGNNQPRSNSRLETKIQGSTRELPKINEKIIRSENKKSTLKKMSSVIITPAIKQELIPPTVLTNKSPEKRVSFINRSPKKKNGTAIPSQFHHEFRKYEISQQCKRCGTGRILNKDLVSLCYDCLTLLMKTELTPLYLEYTKTAINLIKNDQAEEVKIAFDKIFFSGENAGNIVFQGKNITIRELEKNLGIKLESVINEIKQKHCVICFKSFQKQQIDTKNKFTSHCGCICCNRACKDVYFEYLFLNPIGKNFECICGFVLNIKILGQIFFDPVVQNSNLIRKAIMNYLKDKFNYNCFNCLKKFNYKLKEIMISLFFKLRIENHEAEKIFNKKISHLACTECYNSLKLKKDTTIDCFICSQKHFISKVEPIEGDELKVDSKKESNEHCKLF